MFSSTVKPQTASLQANLIRDTVTSIVRTSLSIEGPESATLDSGVAGELDMQHGGRSMEDTRHSVTTQPAYQTTLGI